MIISKTPLRISFFGGGSDLPAYYTKYPGSVISTSINLYIYVIVKKRNDDKIYINYSKKEIVDDINDIQHDLVKECLKMTGIKSGIEITTLSDISSKGSGLGSSSAVTVGLLNALYCFKKIKLSNEELAEKACEIEINKCGHPIGKQDQYGCSIGGLNRINFHKNHDVSFSNINFELDKFQKNLFLVNTNVTRNANTILEDQSNNAKDVINENVELVKMCNEFEKLLKMSNFDIDKIGFLLNKSWQIKKKLSNKISSTQIDNLYNRGIHEGASGGKVLGAGGGGYILFYVPTKNQRNFINSFTKDIVNFEFESYGTKIVYNEYLKT